MSNVIPLLFVWAFLCAIIIGYVVYRFATDRPDGAQRHPLWPMVSNPSDPMLPDSDRRFSWIGYFTVIAGLAGLVLMIGAEGAGVQTANWIGVTSVVLISAGAMAVAWDIRRRSRR